VVAPQSVRLPLQPALLDRGAAPGHHPLEIFDLQQEMLDHTMRCAAEAGLSNVVPTQGDARSMPYPDGSIDGAYLTTVLGEIPDQQAALDELARVLRPGGRLVVGEIALDPHFVRFSVLSERATAAGLRFGLRTGGPLAYFARFDKPA
jgi:ubiquinone/menaquinone biosynthesis C-methylase UbiE